MTGKKSFCEIILGSYEEFILGFKYSKKGEAQQTFAVHSHAGSIRCVTTSGDLLASGGADDRIVIYNLKTRKEHCLLTHHNGTVNCLQFTNEHTHLISGGQDGMLAIVRAGNWQLEKVWENAHKGSAILDIALHSSGKLMLSLGADATLRTWNLVKGRQAYVINLNSKSKEPKCLHTIKWAPDGQRFVLVGSQYTDVWGIESGGVLKSIKHKHKISSCIWYSDEKLIVGYEEGKIGVVDIESEEIVVHDAHSGRVKCMALHGNKVVTASSTGELKVWSAKFKQLCSANAGCRFTCMCLVSLEGEIKEETDTVIDVNDTLVQDVNDGSVVDGKKKAKHVLVEIEEDDVEVKLQVMKVKKCKVASVEVPENLEDADVVIKSVKKQKQKKKKLKN